MWRNWQTRTVQVRVNASSWGFESLHPHQRKKNGFGRSFFFYTDRDSNPKGYSAMLIQTVMTASATRMFVFGMPFSAIPSGSAPPLCARTVTSSYMKDM